MGHLDSNAGKNSTNFVSNAYRVLRRVGSLFLGINIGNVLCFFRLVSVSEVSSSAGTESGPCSNSFSTTMLLLNIPPRGRSTVPTVLFERFTRSKYLSNMVICFEAIVSSSPVALSAGIEASVPSATSFVEWPSISLTPSADCSRTIHAVVLSQKLSVNT